MTIILIISTIQYYMTIYIYSTGASRKHRLLSTVYHWIFKKTWNIKFDDVYFGSPIRNCACCEHHPFPASPWGMLWVLPHPVASTDGPTLRALTGLITVAPPGFRQVPRALLPKGDLDLSWSVSTWMSKYWKIAIRKYSGKIWKNEAKSWDSHWHCSKELSGPASKAATPSAAEMQPAPWTAGSLDLLSCRTQTGSSAKSKEFRGSQIWQSDDVLFQVLFCTDWRDCVCISQGDRMENKVCSFQLGFKAEKGVQDCIPGQN